MIEKLKFTLKAWPGIALATIGVSVLTEYVSGLVGYPLREQALMDAVRRMAGWNAAFASLAFQVLVVAPVLEETVFRFVLWKLPRPGRLRIAAVTSSVLFAGAHYLQMPWPDSAFLALFFFGMAQCWLYRKTDALWCPMLNHALFNATNLVLVFALPK